MRVIWGKHLASWELGDFALISQHRISPSYFIAFYGENYMVVFNLWIHEGL